MQRLVLGASEWSKKMSYFSAFILNIWAGLLEKPKPTAETLQRLWFDIRSGVGVGDIILFFLNLSK